MKRLVLFFVGVGVLAGAAILAFSSVSATDSQSQKGNENGANQEAKPQVESPGDQAPKGPVVLVEKVTSRPEVVRRKYTGSFEPIQEVVVLSRVSGNIEQQLFQEGNFVKADSVLFEMEKVRYEAALEEARAGVASSEAQIATCQAKRAQCKAKLTYAQNNYDRNKALFERGGNLVTQDTLDNVQSALDALVAEQASIDAEELAAKAGLDAAKAKLKLAGDDMDHTTIRAMISGRAGRVLKTVGNYVTPASGPLVTIIQMDPIYLRFSVSEKDFTTMFGNVDRLRSEAHIKIEMANGEMYDETGEIAFIDNKMTSETNTINIWATFKNSNELLNPDGVATVYLEKQEDSMLPAVRDSAVLFDGKKHSVYILGEGNVVEKRDVETGAADGDYRTIVSGLTEGEVVIIDGTHKIRFLPGPDGKPLPVIVQPTFTPTPTAVDDTGEHKSASNKQSARAEGKLI